MTVTRRVVLAGLATPAAARAAGAQQGWAPSRPLRLVVAYPAGGPTDVIARIVAQDISGPLGQNVIVENMAGASGAIGTRAVAKAEPDGHTLTFGNNQTHGNNTFMLKEPGYDPVRDFYPLAGAGAFEHVFVVRNELPVKSVQELIAYARANPNKLNYGSTGIGSGSHLSMELFMAKTGLVMTHVPYKGAPPLVQDLVANRIDVANSTMPSVLEQVKAGEMRALAIGSAQRNAKLSDVPTLSEQGVRDADASSWTAFFAPVNTLKPALDRLSGEILAALKKPSVVDAIDKLGFTVQARAPEAFRPYHEKEIATWVAIAKAAAIQAS